MTKTKKGLIIGLISMLTLTALCFSMVGCSNSNTDKNPVGIETVKETAIAGGMQVGESQNFGISLMSATIDPEHYADYGIATAAETAVTINATISPSEVVDKSVTWALSWENPSDTWASGKNVEDYVTLNGGSTSATVSCKQAFGEQIVLTATAQANPDFKATCKLEYAQKISSVQLNIGNIPLNVGGNTTIKYEIGKGVTGPGGVVSSTITKSDVYTLAESFVESVSITHDTDSNNWFQVNDLFPSGMATFKGNTENYKGQSLYFDYDHDIVNWLIMQRAGDIAFKNLTTAEIQGYFENITCPTIGTINYTFTGAYGTFTYSSTLLCDGFTNNTPISALDLDTTTYVF